MLVSSNFMKMVTPCWRPSTDDDDDDRSSDVVGKTSGLLWHKDLGFHVNGEFSMAVIQANNIIEDHSRLESGFLGSNETGPRGTFVGIYDGHGGAEAAKYVNEHLFKHFQRFASEEGRISTAVIQRTFSATEAGFISLVKKHWQNKPGMASVGTCVLVGIVCSGTLYIANLGDSRAVLAKLDRALKQVFPVQLSSEHNAAIESVRDELHRLHPNDPHIVVMKHRVWRVKGIIQISRSIGDAYLKDSMFNKEPLVAKFRLPDTFYAPILSAEPAIVEHKLCPDDQFIIFASDGLWEHLSNQEAINIVHQNPRSGIAKRLIEAALQEAAKKREMRYSDLKKIDRGVRRHFHDDISVVVLFLDAHYMSRSSSDVQRVSIRGGGRPA